VKKKWDEWLRTFGPVIILDMTTMMMMMMLLLSGSGIPKNE
jgi:hypothetical protein